MRHWMEEERAIGSLLSLLAVIAVMAVVVGLVLPWLEARQRPATSRVSLSARRRPRAGVRPLSGLS